MTSEYAVAQINFGGEDIWSVCHVYHVPPYCLIQQLVYECARSPLADAVYLTQGYVHD
jgi:hypothetical protein